MDLAIYPLGAVIRTKAKQRLRLNSVGAGLRATWDEALFRELTANLLQSAQWEILQQPCETAEAAAMLEDLAALSLAAAYFRIVQKRCQPDIQQLNALL